MKNYDYVYNQFSRLTNWLQYDVLQLQSISPEDRNSLFDFIVCELEELAQRHSHRIRSIVTTLKNNKDKLFDVVNELNIEFESLAVKHGISLSDSWDICNNARYNLDGNQYHLNLIKFYDKHVDHFDYIENDVLKTIAQVHRSISLLKTLNS